MYGRFLRCLSNNVRALSPKNTTRNSAVNIHVGIRCRLLASMADAETTEGKLSKKLVFLTVYLLHLCVRFVVKCVSNLGTV
jgi:hypothetical protein